MIFFYSPLLYTLYSFFNVLLVARDANSGLSSTFSAARETPSIVFCNEPLIGSKYEGLRGVRH